MPKRDRQEKIIAIVDLRVHEIIDDMEDILKTILQSSIKCKESISKENIHLIRKVDFNDQSVIGDIEYIDRTEQKGIQLSKFLKNKINEIKEKTSNLISSYYPELSLSLLCLLEEVDHAYLHNSTFATLLDGNLKIDFSESMEIFDEYYILIEKLKEFKRKDLLG